MEVRDLEVNDYFAMGDYVFEVLPDEQVRSIGSINKSGNLRVNVQEPTACNQYASVKRVNLSVEGRRR